MALTALMVAGRAHRGQTRKFSNSPYIEHPIRVATKAALAGLSPAVVAAGALHDVIEDTPTTLADIAVYGLPDYTLALVQLLTKPHEGPLTEVEAKLYYDGIRADPNAAALKVLDRTDNLQEMWDLLYAPTLFVRGELPALRAWAHAYLGKSARYISPLLPVLVTPPWVAELYAAMIENLHLVLPAKKSG